MMRRDGIGGIQEDLRVETEHEKLFRCDCQQDNELAYLLVLAESY